MEIRADQRTQHATKDPESVAALTEGAQTQRALQIRMARTLATIDRKAAFVFCNVTSAFDLAVSVGWSRRDASLLLHLGRAMAADAELERAVDAGEIGLDQASWLGRILPYRKYLRPGDRWISLASEKSAWHVQRAVKRRIEETEEGAAGDALVTLTVDVPTKAVEDLRRARVLASRTAGRVLTEGQTVSAVIADYLERHDPLLAEGGTRRVGATAELVEDRYVPAAVKAAIYQRSGDRCERCRATGFLQFAHVRPHRHGSSREADDLMRLCGLCHLLYDAGYVWLEGDWPNAVFVDAWGNRATPPGAVASVTSTHDRTAHGRTDGRRAPTNGLAGRNGSVEVPLPRATESGGSSSSGPESGSESGPAADRVGERVARYVARRGCRREPPLVFC